MGVYTAPAQLAYTVSGAKLDTYLSMNSGTYYTEVQEWDNCGGAAKTPITVTVSGGKGIPSSSHVFIVMEENHSYSSVIGNSGMPYLNSLASKYGLATQYYANTHPSIGNYFMLTTGAVITNDDSFCSTISNDNVVRHLLTAGKTWKSYAESLPYAGYTGCSTGQYAKKHNPLAFFSDVANSSEKYNLVPFTQFSKDLANNALPNYSFIVPNLMDDAHDGTLQAADWWLKVNIAPLFANPTFQKDGLLLIIFDEGSGSDNAYGGGHVAAIAIGPHVRAGNKTSSLYQHQNALRTLLQALGLSSFPGAGSSASPMSNMF
jgi:acid phosphatase